MSNPSTHPRVTLEEDFANYLAAAERSGRGGVVQLVAASAASPLAAPVWRQLSRLREAGCEVVIVLGPQAPAAPGVLSTALTLADCRIARFRGAEDLVEQLVLGDAICWTGGGAPIQTSSAADPNPQVVAAAKASFRFVQALSTPLTGDMLARSRSTARGWFRRDDRHDNPWGVAA